MRNIIIDHAKKYPLMQPTDAVKLIYQATFGGGHMIRDEQTALEYIRHEYSSLIHSGEAMLCESLGETSRVYLGGELTDEQLSLIAKIFCESARLYAVGFTEASEIVKNKFLSRLETLIEICREGYFAFDESSLQAYLTEYAAAGYPPVSHSAVYREAYSPAYRVIDSRYTSLLPCIQKIESLVRKSTDSVVIALDGRCAAGKTTASKLIAPLFDAQIIHMDDFFLPPELRSKKRLSEVGGNIHYERFLDEVIPNLRSGLAFEHQVFDCSQFAYLSTPRTVVPSRVAIVEGVYSLHPIFEKYYDISVFADISPTQQLVRIKNRGQEALLQRFQNEWIPMEERYFKEFNIQTKCELTI